MYQIKYALKEKKTIVHVYGIILSVIYNENNETLSIYGNKLIKARSCIMQVYR